MRSLRSHLPSIDKALVLTIAPLALMGCIEKEIIGGGGSSTTTSSNGGAESTSSAGSGGATTMGGSGGASSGGMGGAAMGGAPMGGAPMGGAGGAMMTGGSGGAVEGAGWSRNFGDYADQDAWGVAAMPNGDLVVIGSMNETMHMDAFPLETSLVQDPISGQMKHKGKDVYVARLDPNGNVVWAKNFGNATFHDGYDVASDPQGNILITGGFTGTQSFGGPALVSAGFEDLFVVKLDGNGDHVWSKRFGDSVDQPQFPGSHIATDASGAVIVAGQYMGTMDFGGGALSTGGQTQVDLFVAKLDANGNHVWSKRFGDLESGIQSGEKCRALGVDSSGAVVLSGTMDGTINFGGGALTTPDGAFVVKLSSAGAHVWSKAFGQFGGDMTALAITPQDDVVLAGYFGDVVDYGGGQLTKFNGTEVIVKLDAAGQFQWNKQYAGPVYMNHGAASPSGAITFVGHTGDALDASGLGGPVLPSIDGFQNAAILSVDGTGALLAVKNYSTPSAAVSPAHPLNSVAYDAAGYLLVVGSVHGNVDLGFGALQSDYSYNQPDALIARLPPSL